MSALCSHYFRCNPHDFNAPCYRHHDFQINNGAHLLASVVTGSHVAPNLASRLPVTRVLSNPYPQTISPSPVARLPKRPQTQKNTRCLRCHVDDKGKGRCEGAALCNRCSQHSDPSALSTAEPPTLWCAGWVMFDWKIWLQSVRSIGPHVSSHQSQCSPSSHSPFDAACLEDGPHRPIPFELSVQDRMSENRVKQRGPQDEINANCDSEPIEAVHDSIETDMVSPADVHYRELCLCYHSETTSERTPRIDMDHLDRFVKEQMWGEMFDSADKTSLTTNECKLQDASKLLAGYMSLISSLPTTLVPYPSPRSWTQTTIVAHELVFAYLFRSQHLLMTTATICNFMVKNQHEQPLTMTLFNALEIIYRGLNQFIDNPWRLSSVMSEHPIALLYDRMLKNAVSISNQIATFDCRLRRAIQPRRKRISKPVDYMRAQDANIGARFPQRICVTITSIECLSWGFLGTTHIPQMTDPVISIFQALNLTSSSTITDELFDFNISSPTALVNKENREKSINSIVQEGLKGQEDMEFKRQRRLSSCHTLTPTLLSATGDFSVDHDLAVTEGDGHD